MRSRQVTAVLASLALGAGFAGACGGASTGDREDLDQSNESRDIPEGTPSTIETGATTLGSTGEAQPTVTQPETTP